MSVVRELTTLFTFKTEEAGLNQYHAAIAGVKSAAKSLLTMVGIGFGIEKVVGFVEGLIDAGKEINKITYQIGRLARDGDDFSKIQDTLLESATKLSLPYADVAKTFKQMLLESQNLKISQEGVLTATENIFKSFRVGRMSKEESEQAQGTLESIMRRGGLKTERSIRTLNTQAPELMRTIMEAFGQTTIDGMIKLGKAGGLTTDKIMEGIAKKNERLDADFAKAPIKLGQALTNIYSRLTAVSARFYKLIDNSANAGKAITWAFNLAADSVTKVIKALGGVETAIRLVSFALAGVALYKFAPMLLTAARALNIFSLAAWRAALPFIAGAAAIAAFAVAAEDLFVWMTGGDSLIGSWVGSFEDLKKSLSEAFNTSGWTAPFVALKEVFVAIGVLIDDFNKGDFKKFFTDLSGGDLGAALLKLLDSLTTMKGLISAIGIMFVSWEALKFVGLIGALKTITQAALAVTGLSVAAPVATAAAGAAGAGVAGAEIAGGGVAARLAGPRLVALAASNPWMTAIIAAATTAALVREASDKEKDPATNIAREKLNKERRIPWGQTPSDGFDPWGRPIQDDKPPQVEIAPSKPILVIPQVLPNVYTPPSIMPGELSPRLLTPGPVTNNQENKFNQSNTIHVTTDTSDLASKIQSALQTVTSAGLDKMARDIINSSPRTENATQ